MQVTYQELVNDFYLDYENRNFNDYDIKKAFLNSHEIRSDQYEAFKDRFWDDDTVYWGILNLDEVRKLYFENDYLINKYFEIKFTDDRRGDSFQLDMRKEHDFRSNLSCYPSVLLKDIVLKSSNIWVVKGNKYIPEGTYSEGYYNVMMLRCKNKYNDEFTYYDIVEDPGTKKINLPQ